MVVTTFLASRYVGASNYGAITTLRKSAKPNADEEKYGDLPYPAATGSNNGAPIAFQPSAALRQRLSSVGLRLDVTWVSQGTVKCSTIFTKAYGGGGPCVAAGRNSSSSRAKL